MSLPSDMLDSVVAILGDNLPGEVNVEIFDRAFGARDADYVTLPYPSVLVSCTRLSGVDGYTPPVVTGYFVAVCISRFDEPAAGLSSGDAALNLAAMVAAIVDGQRWQGRGFSIPRSVRVDSLQARTLEGRELSGWTVRWEQDFELTFPAEPLERFRYLGITIPMGDENTPDIHAEHVAPEVIAP